MKKLKIIIICLMLLAIVPMVACAPQDNNLIVDTISPFLGSDYEYTEYTIQKTDINVQDNGERVTTVIAEGKLSFTLETDFDYNDEGLSTVSNNLAKLTTSLRLEYKDNSLVDIEDRGKIDTIESVAIFSTLSLSPYKSYKKVSIAERDNTVNPSYTIDANYVSSSASIVYASDGSKSSLSLGSKVTNFIDNEYLYFALRSAKNITPNSSFYFNLSVLYDSFGQDKFALYPMMAATAQNLASVPIASSVNIDGLETEDGQKKLDTLQTGLAINQTNRGPDIALNFASKPFYIDSQSQEVYVADTKRHDNDGSMSKVLISMQTSEYEGLTQKYTTTYTLSQYSITKPEATTL